MAQLTNVRISIDNETIENFVNLDLFQDIYNISSFQISYEMSTLENPGDFLVERSKSFIGKTCIINSEFREVGSSQSGEGFSFRGIVTEVHSSKSGMRSGDLITIHGKSPDIILNGKPTCRTFLDKTIEQIVNEVLQPYPRNILNPSVSPRNTESLTYVVQYMESDYQFLRRIAIRYGEWFYYNGQDLVFGELSDAGESDLVLGRNLDSFQFDLKTIPTKSSYRYVHDSEKEILSWESGNNNVEQQLNEYGRHTYNESNQLFSEQAVRNFNHLNIDPGNYQAGLDNAGLLEETADVLNINNISGNGTHMGLKIGQVINISNAEADGSEQSYGQYRISSLSHSCDQVFNYDNSFIATEADSDVPEITDPNAIIRSGPIRGQVRDNADPDKYGRVVVDYGWVAGQDDNTPWIRVMTPYTMHQGGNFFVPEIGTDVLVAFEDGDMERPYVMGAFNTSPNQFCPDPAWGDATPDIKAIRTRSGHTVEFHDVDGSEHIRIYDKDEVNEIILDPVNNELKIHSTETLKIEAKEIEITAEQGIVIAAGQGIAVEAGQGIEVEASQAMELKGQEITAESQGGNIGLEASGGDVTLQGMNIDIAANAQFTAAGNAGSEVSTSAILTLRGSMVNIN